MSDTRLKQNVLQRFSTIEAKIIRIRDHFEKLRQLGIDTEIEDHDPRAYKIRLALGLAGSQRRQQAVRLNESDLRRNETNAVAVPIRELTGDKIRIVEYGVKAGRTIVGRILIARRIERRRSITQPVAIDRRLDRRHLRANLCSA